jgi:predicted RNA-binding Zn-ribbon protein involved in translation (DUF1610 family)
MRGEMTTIRTTCPRCGEVDMSPEAILLSIRDQRGEGSYRFACPECLNTIEKPADRKVVALLLSAGVELADAGTDDLEHEPEPDGYEPLELHAGGPPFTVDDLITFHFLLKDDEELSRLLPRS